MGQPGTAELIAEFLLHYYREPMRYRAQAPRAARTYGNLDSVLRLALGRPGEFAPSALHGPAVAAELERAATFFIQQQFFRDDATHYDVLGLASDASPDAVRENFRLVMQLIHPDRQGADATWPESYAARANKAHTVLKSPQSRADYDNKLAAVHAREILPKATPAASGTRVPARAAPRPLRSAPTSMLPEWLTATVGGFVRNHPGASAFALLIVVSVMAVFAVIDRDEEGMLTADSGYSASPVKRGQSARPSLPPRELPPADVPGRVADVPATEPMRVSAVPSLQPPASESATLTKVASDTPERSVAATPTVVPLPAKVAQPAAIAPQPALAARQPPATIASQSAAARVAADPPPVAAVPARPAPPSPPVAVAVPIRPDPAAATPARPQPAPVQATTQPVQTSPQAGQSPAPPPAAPVQVANLAPAPVPAAAAIIPTTVERPPATPVAPPGSAEVEILMATFVSSYEKGQLDAFTRLFDGDAQANQQRGRAAIASEYDQLFRSTIWRRMAISQLVWKPVGDHTEAKGEFLVKTGWRDGREVEQRVAVDMEFVRQGGRAVIGKLNLQPRQ